MREKYLLDTCALNALKKPYADGHIQHVRRLGLLDDDDRICASILSIYELEYGASHTPNLQLANETRQAIRSIRDRFEIISIPLGGGEIFGALKELYKEWESPTWNKKRLGTKAIIKHNIDLIIATTALIEGAIFVTNDTIAPILQEICSQFRYEDWTK
jgi:predicted nucleic acid-binding protein